eukprot:196200_1
MSNEQIANNINQHCYCGKALSKDKINEKWKCNYCYQSYPKDVETYYECGDSKCKWYQISSCYIICEECYQTVDDVKVDDNELFIENKIKANLNIIRKQIEKCKHTNEKRRYMYKVYTTLYKDWIRKLNDKQMIKTSILDDFNVFYESELVKIVTEIDEKAFEVTGDIFINDEKDEKK